MCAATVGVCGPAWIGKIKSSSCKNGQIAMHMRFFVTVLAWNVQRWEYKDDNGWRRYAPNVAAEVEQAYNERFKGIRLRITRHLYVLGWCVPCAEDERWTEKNFSSLSICCLFLCCRDKKVMLYVVDFSTSKQTNENTKWVNSPKTHAYDRPLSMTLSVDTSVQFVAMSDQ